MGNKITLNGNDWRFKGYLGEDWVWRNGEKPTTRDLRYWYQGTVPGSVHQDLWENNQIPDPYWELNSLAIEWVPDRTWIYKKTFTADPAWQGQRVALHFKGVDYEAQFFLNGERLGEHVGMYTPAAFEVGSKLKYGEENMISVVIEPAPHEQPQVSKTTRVRTHKSRMTYWWDFCPRMIHIGIWDDVYLEVTGPAKVAQVWVRPQLSTDHRQADITVTATIDAALASPAAEAAVATAAGTAPAVNVGTAETLNAAPAASAAVSPSAVAMPVVEASATLTVEATVRLNGQVVATAQAPYTVNGCQGSVALPLTVANPALWWPNGHGAQPLYQAEVRLLGPDGSVWDLQESTFGIRSVELVQNEKADPAARPYTFVVNGKKIYIKGWNWVPIDALYGVERPEKLERLLTLARNAHCNMLRVWGGGLIEKDAFYDLCDRYGIMVWQEFIQSSSGINNKPSTEPEFIDMMVNEAEQIIPRKRNHPSLVVWCGGNELGDLQGRPITNEEPVIGALKDAVNRLDPDRVWLPSSPSGPVYNNSLESIRKDPTALHDVHGPWEHQGLTGQYELYNQGTCLLHSEFGLEGMTNRKALDATIAPENQWPATRDNPLYFHRGSWWVNEPLVQKEFGGIDQVEPLRKASQFFQFEGLRYALEADRRRAYQCSGTLPWQFNEPYPNAYCTSALDYYGQPKSGYFAVAQAYEPLHVSAAFATQAWAGRESFEATLWVSNSDGSGSGTLKVALVGASGKVYLQREGNVSYEGNRSTRVQAVQLPLAEIGEELFYLDLALTGADGTVASVNRYLFTKAETLAAMLTAPTTTVTVQQEGDRITVTNTGVYTALAIWLEDGRSFNAPGYVYFGANHFDLLPGESRTVAVAWTADVPAGDRWIAVRAW
ncbi:MAG: glycosyl hydrolase 2 galactose-binding domain-containing protein, partial [Mycobacterium leprae]